MKSTRYIVNVEAAIVHGERYLMIVRGQRETHAPGALSMVGGKVEGAGNVASVLEATLRREIAEEVGVEVAPEPEYIESKSFVSDDGDPVIDVVFLCYYSGGTPAIADPGEVRAIRWMTAAEILAHPQAPPWLRQSIELAERMRIAKLR
jgi:8-oxo-dGTP pyrophosphatase MutT (NUDIX family)